jgi:hypothetical protein
MGKLNVVNFSLDYKERYTFWSGLLGGFFPGAFVFRHGPIAGAALPRGRLARRQPFRPPLQRVLKIPMQFFILFIGVMVFIFFQFEKPPMFFNQPAYKLAEAGEQGATLAALQAAMTPRSRRSRPCARAHRRVGFRHRGEH